MLEESTHIQARKSQLQFYRKVPLYTKVSPIKFVLYKPAGIALGEMRIDKGKHPDMLYIKLSDKLEGLREAQKAFNEQLELHVKSGDLNRVKQTVVTIVEETLLEPRSGSLEGLSETVNILVTGYSKQFDVIRQLIDIASADYSTALHSINVMAFALAFAYCHDYSESDSETFGLCALLHDVGKTKIDPQILAAPRKLTDSEFTIMKSHTTIGFEILAQCRFGPQEIRVTALDHHERIDGSGYPSRKTELSRTSQIIGLVDCYEALTNDDRPYRNAIDGFQALNQIVKQDVRDGRFDADIYSQFVKSLSKR